VRLIFSRFCFSIVGVFCTLFTPISGHAAERIPINLDTVVKVNGQTHRVQLTVRDGQSGFVDQSTNNHVMNQFRIKPTLVVCEEKDCVNLEVEVRNAEGRIISRPNTLVQVGQRARISQTSSRAEGESTVEMSVTPTLAK
jgi:hypothetical protein